MPNPNTEQSNNGGLPQEDVVVLAGSIAQRLIEHPDASGEQTEIAGITAPQLTDMSAEELDAWFDSGNIHNGSHFMSPADNEAYQRLCETDLPGAVKFLRDKWGEYADYEFIDGFTLVHWVGSSEHGLTGLEKLLAESKHEAEISTQAYADQGSLAENPRWVRAKFGVLVDGQVTLASNADIQTNQWHGLQEDDVVKRRKYTEWANRLMTNADNCTSPYEFVIGDWQATGIIVDPDTGVMDEIVAIANKYSLPIISTVESDLFSPAT